MLQPTRCAWSHTSLSRLHAFWMQVRRHLQGENIPNQSDLGKVWVQEYKVLLRQTEQRMKDSAHIFSSEAQSETEGATSTSTTSLSTACACTSPAWLSMPGFAAGAAAC